MCGLVVWAGTVDVACVELLETLDLRWIGVLNGSLGLPQNGIGFMFVLFGPEETDEEEEEEEGVVALEIKVIAAESLWLETLDTFLELL